MEEKQRRRSWECLILDHVMVMVMVMIDGEKAMTSLFSITDVEIILWLWCDIIWYDRDIIIIWYNIIWSWYGYDMVMMYDMIWLWYGHDMVMIWYDMIMIWSWYGYDMVMIWSWYMRWYGLITYEMVMIWSRYGHDGAMWLPMTIANCVQVPRVPRRVGGAISPW